MENSSFILGRHVEDLPEPSIVPGLLRRLWPSPSDQSRWLWWRFDFPTDGIVLGDCGVLESSMGRAYGFRKLGNVATELTIEITGPRNWYEQVGPLEFQYAVRYAVAVPDLTHVFCRNSYSEYVTGSRCSFSWEMNLVGGWQYLVENAAQLAAKHGVLPEDLIISKFVLAYRIRRAS